MRCPKYVAIVNRCLSTETVESTARALEGVHDIKRGDSFPLGVLGVSDRITNDILQEDLKDTTSLFVNETGDTLDTTTASKTTNSGFCYALNVVTKDLAVTLGSSLSETFAAFTTSRHACVSMSSVWVGRE